MEKIRLPRNSEIKFIFAWLKSSIYIAMQGMVNPSLRCVAINWTSLKKRPELLFFHDGLTIGDNLRDDYSCIESEATCTTPPNYPGEYVDMRIQFIPLTSSKPIPKVSEVVYLRKEPGFEFNEINHYIPNWPCTSIIRLKINEALRGKVTPDLRQIQFRWIKPEKEALITYIHNGPVTPAIETHYKEMFEIATAVPWKSGGDTVIPHMEVVPVPYPAPFPEDELEEIFYIRKEPFEDPKEEDELHI